MLVLSRRKDESIIIGVSSDSNSDIAENISIKIIEIRGDKVRLGISGPPEIPVHRKEIWLKIQKDKEQEQALKDENSKLLNYAEEVAEENLQLRALLTNKEL